MNNQHSRRLVITLCALAVATTVGVAMFVCRDSPHGEEALVLVDNRSGSEIRNVSVYNDRGDTFNFARIDAGEDGVSSGRARGNSKWVMRYRCGEELFEKHFGGVYGPQPIRVVRVSVLDCGNARLHMW